MNNEKNRPPLILVLLVLVGLLVIATYIFRVGDFSFKKVEQQSIDPRTLAEVSWQKPQEISKMNIFGFTDDFKEVQSKYFVVGKVTNGKYQGGDMILYALASEDFNGPGFGLTFYRFIRQNGEWYLIAPKDQVPPNASSTAYSVDSSYTIPGLSISEYLTGPKGEILNYEPYAQDFFPEDTTNLTKVFTDKQMGDVYISNAKSNPSNSRGVFDSNGFYVRLPDGTTAVYALAIPFVAKDGSVTITWNDKSITHDDYSFTDRTGCGSTNYAAVESSTTLSDLINSGTTSNGDNVYELKNLDAPLLHTLYEIYAKYRGITYAQFVASHPVFFWKDSFGRLIRFQNMQFLPQAECGKPVIYLYPTEKTAVNVQLSPAGGFSYTEPKYPQGGWNVIAEPNGTLTDISSIASVNSATTKNISKTANLPTNTYPYLFWEGRGGIYLTPDKGFVIAQKDVHLFLVEKLALLGLNEKETQDFMEYWEPKFQGSPYYFITFLGKKEMDRIAPLTVTPHPDTVIRILMDFKPLKEPIAVESYLIKTPERKGFTVVEWGGVLRGTEGK